MQCSHLIASVPCVWPEQSSVGIVVKERGPQHRHGDVFIVDMLEAYDRHCKWYVALARIENVVRLGVAVDTCSAFVSCVCVCACMCEYV